MLFQKNYNNVCISFILNNNVLGSPILADPCACVTWYFVLYKQFRAILEHSLRCIA